MKCILSLAVMCGIFLAIAKHSSEHALPKPDLQSLLDKRGPDSGKHVVRSLVDLSLNFYATVLSLRGNEVVPQPLEDASTHCRLCWNGEAWKIGASRVSGNDGEAVFQLLLSAVAESCTCKKILHDLSCSVEDNLQDDPIVRVLSSIAGPFAFAFHDHVHGRIYFGRDSIGRRSLLIKAEADHLSISSVSDGTSGWVEVPADGIYSLCLESVHLLFTSVSDQVSEADVFISSDAGLTKYPYKQYDKYPIFNHSIPAVECAGLEVDSSAVSRLEQLLRDSLAVRTATIPHHQPQKAATTASSDYTLSKAFIARPEELPRPRLAVLFSGGLDCTVLARMIHDLLPAEEEVDLLNVAFHNPRTHGAFATDKMSTFELCPDRVTARSALAELQEVCPERNWRLVEINVPYTEAQDHRSRIVSLMYPHATEMDLSIAFALYFAARGVGETNLANGEIVNYETPARVLFSGLGADELFGGYQRHATAYNRNAFTGLLEELELDINRLGQRNLGRDDRVISHWSKEARYPFLDEDLLSWAITAPVNDKCGFGLASVQTRRAGIPEIEPGKQVLRLLALKLGMVNVAREKKRAIQFGARTAKMEGGTTTGTQRIS